MPESVLVHGEIVLPAKMMPGIPAFVRVEVEDISRADMPSEVVAQRSISTGIVHGGDVIPFEIEVPASVIDPQRLYSVRAHVAMSGSGEIEIGDFISMQSFPVLTRGHGNQVRVEVRLV